MVAFTWKLLLIAGGRSFVFSFGMHWERMGKQKPGGSSTHQQDSEKWERIGRNLLWRFGSDLGLWEALVIPCFALLCFALLCFLTAFAFFCARVRIDLDEVLHSRFVLPFCDMSMWMWTLLM